LSSKGMHYAFVIVLIVLSLITAAVCAACRRRRPSICARPSVSGSAGKNGTKALP
jgi:hypothetical protein